MCITVIFRRARLRDTTELEGHPLHVFMMSGFTVESRLRSLFFFAEMDPRLNVRRRRAAGLTPAAVPSSA